MAVVASTGMPGPKRVTLSVKLTEVTVNRLRTFVRDNAGKPLYLEMGTFVEQAILAHLNTCESRLNHGGPDTRLHNLDDESLTHRNGRR